jgi:DNA ligase-1
MKHLALLRMQLEDAAATSLKVDALLAYFRCAATEDAAWVVHFALKGRVPRALPLATLRAWIAEASGLPDWMLEECLNHGRNAAETFALLLPGKLPAPGREAAAPGIHRPMELQLGLYPEASAPPDETGPETLASLIAHAEGLRAMPQGEERRHRAWRIWGRLGLRERVLWHELLLGKPHIDCTRKQLIAALARFARLPNQVVEQRLHPGWRPSPGAFQSLCAPEPNPASRPPTATWEEAALLDRPPESLGVPEDWCCEWAWDGLPGRLVRSGDGCEIWSFEGECLTHRFPELEMQGLGLPPGTVLTGSILAWSGSIPLPRAALQPRLSGRRPSEDVRDGWPVVFLVHDLAELEGRCLVDAPESMRRSHLETWMAGHPGVHLQAHSGIVSPPRRQSDLFEPGESAASKRTHPPGLIRVAERMFPGSWADADAWRRTARARGAIGLLLRPKDDAAGGLKRRREAWVWLQDPLVARMVLIATRPLAGAPDGSFQEFNLAVWKGSELIPMAWVLATLPEGELDELQMLIREDRTARFGPVRAVRPRLVFDVAFLSIFNSSRHRSGCVLGGARILRWARSLAAHEAGTLDALRAHMPPST